MKDHIITKTDDTLLREILFSQAKLYWFCDCTVKAVPKLRDDH